MAKLLLIEETKVLKVRLERLFKKMGYNDIVTYEKGALSFINVLKKSGTFKTIVINYDQFEREFDHLIQDIKLQYIDVKPQIFVMTAQADLKLMKDLYSKGIDDIVAMPFKNEIFIEKLKSSQELNNETRPGLLKQSIQSGNTMLNWCSDFEIGVLEIDQEHKDIIEHFENLYASMKEGHGHEYFSKLIKFLDFYVEHHFAHEEKLQLECRYPHIEEHKAVHNDFKSKVKELIFEYSTKEVTNSDLIKLNLIIKEWLVRHILIEDKKIGAFLNPNE